MIHRDIAIFLSGLALGIAFSWLLESILVGRGVVARYLAPVAFLMPLVLVYLFKK